MRNPRLAITVLGTFLGIGWYAPSGSAQVAVYGEDHGYLQPWNIWVTHGIEAVGLPLGSVTPKTLCCGSTQPTVAQLQQYRAVLVFSRGNAIINGNNLHDYVDSGGGVVIATPANTSQYFQYFQGSWLSQQYDPITPAPLLAGDHQWLGTIHQPAHPLFTVAPVSVFDGGSASFRSSGGLGPNSIRLADWTDGTIFAAERLGLPGRVISLGFLPYSDHFGPGNWVEGTDGYKLMANALYYAGRFDQCAVPETYCTAKVNSVGCTPSMQWAGSPTAAAASVFTINASRVLNVSPGLLLYGFNGRASTPFQNGLLCVAGPQIQRTIGVMSGGSLPPAFNCTGSFALDMSAFARGALGGNPHPALRLPGAVVSCQWWGRDPGYLPPNDTLLTDALEYTVCP